MTHWFAILILMSAPLAGATRSRISSPWRESWEFTEAYQAWDGARFVRRGGVVPAGHDQCTPLQHEFYCWAPPQFHRMLQLRNSPRAATYTVAADTAMDAAYGCVEPCGEAERAGRRKTTPFGTIYG